jgi:Holliday junction resolvase RusA-like endonuclease
MDAIKFTVLGRPQPAGSKRAFIHPSTRRPVVVDAAKESRDDAQVVDQHVFKRYGTPERAEITVRALAPTVADQHAETETETQAA